MQRVKLIAGLIFTGFLLTCTSQAAGFDWRGWDTILNKHVKPTRIDGVAIIGFDYRSLSKSRTQFDQLLTALSKFDPDKISVKNEMLAFWINAYNIGAVKMVLDHPGIKSLNDIGPKKGAVWKMDALLVGGKQYSLDNIENDILRKLNHPLIHFAVVCASVSCPDIHPEAYRAGKLGQQLSKQTRSFLSNPTKGMSFDPAKRQVRLTKLFEWFAADFGGKDRVLVFLARWAPRDAPKDWREFEVGYLDYNWNLNGL